jgi:hypothetical protein
MGHLSWSGGESILRSRRFLSGGVVSTVRLREVENASGGFDVESESPDGNGRLVARMTLRFAQAGEHEMILE